jgi:hypothetical protein
MKNLNSNICKAVVAGSALVGFGAQAALINGGDPNSPYYADFTSSSLGITYNYTGTTSSGSGILNASNTASYVTDTFKDGTKSPGTGGEYHTTPAQFDGSFTLNATIDNNNGVYNVDSTAGGTLVLKGDLLHPLAGGGGFETTYANEVLLTLHLDTHVGAVGAGTKTQDEVDFLFDAPTSLSQNDLAILEDFNLFNFSSTQQVGEIELHLGNFGVPAYNGLLSQSFNNTGLSGYADTFVPESASYAAFGSFLAMVCLATARRKKFVQIF